jgi:hypothetical protein
MPLLKSTITGHGATVSYHKVVGASLTGGTFTVEVASWPTEADALAGRPLVWVERVQVPLAAAADLDAELASSGPFAGATVVEDAADTLEAARTRAWARIKASRSAAEYGGFDCQIGGVTMRFDGDAENQRRLQGAVALAQVAAAVNQPFAVTWTLADNSVVTLSASNITAAGVALGTHVTACFDRGRTLRAQIEAATTKAELDAIIW